MPLFAPIRGDIANFIDSISKFGPEQILQKTTGKKDLGISEFIAGRNNPFYSGNTAQAQQAPTQNYSQNNFSQMDPVQQARLQKINNPTNNTPPGGGGNPSGPGDDRITQLQKMGYLNPIQQQELNSLMQQAPQQPSIDFDALIAPALQSLDEAVAPQQSAYEANVAQIEGGKKRSIEGQQSALSEAQKAAEQARQRNLTQGENVVNEQRRMASELQQGLQSRYGGTTGTGRFAAELAGRQTAQNIAQTRQSISDALQNIDNTVEKVRTATQIAISDAEDKSNELKLQAKQQLDQALANIRLAKGELVGRKAELAANAVQFYQQQLAQVNQANTAFKQNIFLQAQKAEQDLALAKQNASSTAQKLSSQIIGQQPTPYGMQNIYGTVNNKTGEASPFQLPTIGGSSIPGSQQEDEFIDKQAVIR